MEVVVVFVVETGAPPIIMLSGLAPVVVRRKLQKCY